MTKIPSVEEKQQSEEWGAWKFVSEMFDVPHPDKDLADCGIYNTSKCYEQIHDFVVEQKAKARLALLTELRESGLLDDKLYEQGGGYKLGDPTHTVYEKGNNHGHNTLARNIKAHLDELINSTK
jgi:hypothetical protein